MSTEHLTISELMNDIERRPATNGIITITSEERQRVYDVLNKPNIAVGSDRFDRDLIMTRIELARKKLPAHLAKKLAA